MNNRSTLTVWLVGVACALLCAFAFVVHSDDTDAGLYAVLVRNAANDGAWLQLRYLPTIYTPFAEHLPFGFWPFIAAEHLWPSVGPRLGGMVLTLASGYFVFRLARNFQLTANAAALAAFAYLTTESIFAHAALVRLDALLVCFSTASAIGFREFLGSEKTSPRQVVFGSLFLLGGILVKGPFGLVVPLAVVSVTLFQNHLRGRVVGVVIGVVSALVIVGTLAWLDWRNSNSYWRSYFENQILASALGTRTDGSTHIFFAVTTVFHRFWPWLPFALASAWFCFRQKKDGALLAVIALLTVLLSLPSRKVWNHSLVAYPLWATLAAISMERVYLKFQHRRLTAAIVFFSATLLSICAAIAAGLPSKCMFADALRAEIRRLSQNSEISVDVNSKWKVVATLANEYRMLPNLNGNSTLRLVEKDVKISNCTELASDEKLRLLRCE